MTRLIVMISAAVTLAVFAVGCGGPGGTTETVTVTATGDTTEDPPVAEPDPEEDVTTVDEAAADPSQVVLDCLLATDGANVLSDQRSEHGWLLVEFVSGNVHTYVGDAASSADEPDAVAVFTSDSIAEGWSAIPAEDDLALLDTCYGTAGIAPPDRTEAAIEEPVEESVIEPNPDASLQTTCSYVLGDFSETASGYRFVADADVTNTGNIGVVIEVTASWKQAGTKPLKVSKTARVAAGRTKHVGITRVATQDELSLHQATDQGCSVKGTIVDTFGEPRA